MSGYAWHDLVGNIGVAMILGTYFALQIERLDSKSVAYSALNASRRRIHHAVAAVRFQSVGVRRRGCVGGRQSLWSYPRAAASFVQRMNRFLSGDPSRSGSNVPVNTKPRD